MSPSPPHSAPEAMLPHDKQAEQAVLGAVIIRNDLLPQVMDLLETEDFFSTAHQCIYTAMSELTEREDPIDELTLSSWLERRQEIDAAGGAEYLISLAKSTPVAENAEHYASIVREKSQLRKVIVTAYDLAKQGQDGVSNISEFLQEATDKLKAIETGFSERSYTPIKESLLDNFSHLEELSKSPSHSLTGVPTGFSELDKRTCGLQSGDLIILAARPSMGKTAFAMNVALYAASHAKVPTLVFSLEMPKEQLTMRLICSEARIDSEKLRTGNLDAEDWDRLLESTTHMMDAPLLIDDRSGITPAHIRKVLRQAELEYEDIGLVVVDYLQLMQTGRRLNSREQEISEISRNLKAIAKEFSLPMLALSQLNREVERRADKRPTSADLRESGALEQDADIIMFIYRDEVYNNNTEDKGIAEIKIAKHRNGECGSQRLAFIGEYTKFANLALE